MSPFWKSFWSTAGIVGGLSLLSTAGSLGSSTSNGFSWLYWTWGIGVLVWIGIFFAALSALGDRKTDIASGMLAGWAVGFLLLATTCFANLNSEYFESTTSNSTSSRPHQVSFDLRLSAGPRGPIG